MKINLLPPQAKTEISEQRTKKLIIILGVLILIFFLSLSLILFLVENYISREVNSQKTLVNLEKEQLITPEVQKIREEIIQANQNLLELDSFYTKQIKLEEIFKKISEILPPKMYLTNFSWREESLAISLSGFAPDRETLLEFRKNLEKEFPNPHFSPQSLTNPNDFQVNFKINPKDEH